MATNFASNTSTTIISGGVTGISAPAIYTTTILSNTVSGSVIRVNSFVITTNGSFKYPMTVTLSFEDVTSGFSYRITSDTVLPAKTTLTLINRDTSIYLNYNQNLVVFSSGTTSNQSVSAVVAYDTYS